MQRECSHKLNWTARGESLNCAVSELFVYAAESVTGLSACVTVIFR